jgi:hypothetical protein
VTAGVVTVAVATGVEMVAETVGRIEVVPTGGKPPATAAPATPPDARPSTPNM